MPHETQMTLAQMPSGQSGTIVNIHGGHGLSNRLAALGIRKGKTVTKVSGMVLEGPVTIAVDRMQVAIGYGMAGKITVKIEPA